MKDITIADLKENAVKVFSSKKQVMKYVKKYGFVQSDSITITKINDNYIVRKNFKQEEQ